MASYFSFLLTLVTLVTAILWSLERWYWNIAQHTEQKQCPFPGTGKNDRGDRLMYWGRRWIRFLSSMFPTLLLVLIVRSFLYEPYQIPSNSMMPTLWTGDFILVNKYVYGLKDPLLQRQFFLTGKPHRGDIAVFRSPEDPATCFIKRIVGLPGDRVIYRGNQLFIQTAQLSGDDKGWHSVTYQSVTDEKLIYQNLPLLIEREQIGNKSYHILVDPQLTESFDYYQQPGQPIREWVVPAGHYFALGDNRCNSRDSRFWGFIPEQNLVGRATAIWLSLNKQPGNWPKGLRLSRIGPIQ